MNDLGVVGKQITQIIHFWCYFLASGRLGVDDIFTHTLTLTLTKSWCDLYLTFNPNESSRPWLQHIKQLEG